MQQNRKNRGIREATAKPAASVKEQLSPVTVLSLDVQGGTGRQYTGKFKFKVPTMGDRVDISASKARYLTELENVESFGANIAEALAYLHVTIDSESVPEWWTESNNGIDLYDFEPLLSLYAEARAYERRFLGASANVGDGAGEDEAGPGDDGPGDVGEHVSPAPKRREVLADFSPRSSRTHLDDAGDGDSEDGSPS